MRQGFLLKEERLIAYDEAARWDRARIPGKFINSTLQSYLEKSSDDPKSETIQKLIFYLKDGKLRFLATYPSGYTEYEYRHSLYMYGERGVGKSTMAAIIAKERLMQGYEVRFYTFIALMDELQSHYKTGDYHAAMCKIEAIPFLIIDEVGKQIDDTAWSATGDAKKLLHRIIDYRYGNGLPTIFTSNVAPTDLPAQIDPMTVARIDEMSAVLKFEPTNLRQRAVKWTP